VLDTIQIQTQTFSLTRCDRVEETNALDETTAAAMHATVVSSSALVSSTRSHLVRLKVCVWIWIVSGLTGGCAASCLLMLTTVTD
jgi:hypothetical protein